MRDADEVIEASLQALNKWCPSRPGMVRVRMTMVEHVTRDKLPKSLAAVHRFTEDGTAMFSTTSASISAGSSCSVVRAIQIRRRSK